ncbi:(2Fe-2S)-binding protein [Streptomyces cacaoi]|uniref:(2Fe-2S)-binding protein n=1 Tax=Streptomyces cacaoi TaxID=1898 RepID=UPI00260C5F4A|nr:(2Fe-2S)-binding protein [Streptomyces cacaoi]
MNEITVHLKVNGRPHTLRTAGRTTLADLLRDRLGLTGLHLGCEQGVCGACTVIVDGLPMRACLTLAGACEDSDVVTVEGLDGPDADRLRDAFSRHGALQCGFCTPGMLLSAHHLVRARQPLDREEVGVALSGNICRCTGYNGIVSAVREALEGGIAAESAAVTTRNHEE